MESLHKHISPKYLPKEYGGIRPNYPYEHWFINLPKNEKIKEGMYIFTLFKCTTLESALYLQVRRVVPIKVSTLTSYFKKIPVILTGDFFQIDWSFFK